MAQYHFVAPVGYFIDLYNRDKSGIPKVTPIYNSHVDGEENPLKEIVADNVKSGGTTGLAATFGQDFANADCETEALSD